MILEKELNIELVYWQYECGDGCCCEDRVSIVVNGSKVTSCPSYCIEHVLEEVLTHLGYNVKIKTKHIYD